MRKRYNRLPRRKARHLVPEAFVDAAHGPPQRADHSWITNFVQNIRIHQAENLTWQMLRQLGDEHESEPALSTAFRNPRHLLEQDFHLVDALFAQELVRFFNDD